MQYRAPHCRLVVIAGLMLALGSAPLTGCSSDDDPEPTLQVMTPAELDAALADKDFLLINVHVPHDGEIPGTDAHLTYLDAAAIAAYIGDDRSTPVVIYCKSDHMTDIVGPELVAMGYSGVSYLEGGMNAWVAAGYTLDP